MLGPALPARPRKARGRSRVVRAGGGKGRKIGSANAREIEVLVSYAGVARSRSRSASNSFTAFAKTPRPRGKWPSQRQHARPDCPSLVTSISPAIHCALQFRRGAMVEHRASSPSLLARSLLPRASALPPSRALAAHGRPPRSLPPRHRHLPVHCAPPLSCWPFSRTSPAL